MKKILLSLAVVAAIATSFTAIKQAEIIPIEPAPKVAAIIPIEPRVAAIIPIEPFLSQNA